MFKLEDLINDKYEIMERKILRLSKGCSIDAYDAFRALTTEIIAQFAFSRSAGLIEESPDDFKCASVNAIEGTADGVEYMRQYSILRVIAAMLPRRLVARFGGDVGQFMNVLDVSSMYHFPIARTKSTRLVVANLEACSMQICLCAIGKSTRARWSTPLSSTPSKAYPTRKSPSRR